MNRNQALTLLGLGQSAHLGDLKKAYRRLAAKCHPDLNPHLPDAKEKFQDLGIAYACLKGLLPEAPKAPTPDPVRTAQPPAAARKTSTATARVHRAYAWSHTPEKGTQVDVYC